MTAEAMIEVADRVFARRHAELDQTLGLVVGAERGLVVDSGTDEAHGAEWLAAVRAVTPLPLTLLVTHAHWDHFLGTAGLGAGPVLAHPVCRDEIAGNAEQHRDEGVRHFLDAGRPDLAGRVRTARVVVPSELVPGAVELDLGGRTVTLLHPGRGHTGGDVVAHVPDAGVLFAGDLVEQGAPPAVGPDAYPREWPAALDVLLALAPRVIVPGHGDPVDPAFVRGQRDELAAEYLSAGST
ncbi:MAG TPA: MBL fold metallo-hydrolase [Actinophytocola sp.]|uniref:MBL fold metallo-hydrolase n=1 Tax=Actinophytocola sp. TaxID=1872138 RepID=UPI002DC01C44|nr:MBL fold metallo-hydrolase [Actinophytocola sp.]HEU5471183.1 MBL fold metallo-hydrolase [Actinophytocola sp.]